MTIDEIMKLAFNYAVAFEIQGRNQEDDGLLAKQDYAETMLRAAIEQYGKGVREKMHRECVSALGLLMLKELKKGEDGADQKMLNVIDDCASAVESLIK